MPGTASRFPSVGGVVLLVGMLMLAIPPHPFDPPPTWEALLAPYSTGTPLPGGFRVEEIRRGPDNAVVVRVRRPEDGATVEVLIVERGRWSSRHGSRSFTIDYELPRSPAAERDDVTALLAETIRGRDFGLPAPDAVAVRAGDPTVLPWWLEMPRGARGPLLGASLVVLGALVLVRSVGLACAGLALGLIDVAVRLGGVTVSRPDVGAVWIVPLAAMLLGGALRPRRWRSTPAVHAAVALAVVALGLRFLLGPWGPLHVNGHGARFVNGVVRDPGDIVAYGPGYREIFAPIAALAPASPDWAVFACNAALSALIVPLTFAIGRLTGLAASGAFVAALLIAIDPIAIRTGATEAYFVPIGCLAAAASAAMLVALRAHAVGDRWRTAALLVGAGLLLALAARIHPAGWIVMATVPVVVLAGDVGGWQRRGLVMVAAALIAVGVLLATSATALLDVLGNIRSGTVFRPPMPSSWPLVWLALPIAILGAFPRSARFAFPAGVALAALLLTRHAFDASWIWEQAYARLHLTMAVLAVVACMPAGWFHRRAFVASAAVAVGCAWIAFGWPIVAGRTLEHREYRWVRDRLATIPSECRVIHLAFAGPRVLMLPTYAGGSRPAVAIDPARPRTVEEALAPAPCLYYVRGSLCSTVEGRPACEAIERRLHLVPIARTSFAADRERETFAPDTETVETMIARVDGVDGGQDR